MDLARVLRVQGLAAQDPSGSDFHGRNAGERVPTKALRNRSDVIRPKPLNLNPVDLINPKPLNPKPKPCTL